MMMVKSSLLLQRELVGRRGDKCIKSLGWGNRSVLLILRSTLTEITIHIT